MPKGLAGTVYHPPPDDYHDCDRSPGIGYGEPEESGCGSACDRDEAPGDIGHDVERLSPVGDVAVFFRGIEVNAKLPEIHEKRKNCNRNRPPEECLSLLVEDFLDGLVTHEDSRETNQDEAGCEANLADLI